MAYALAVYQNLIIIFITHILYEYTVNQTGSQEPTKE